MKKLLVILIVTMVVLSSCKPAQQENLPLEEDRELGSGIEIILDPSYSVDERDIEVSIPTSTPSSAESVSESSEEESAEQESTASAVAEEASSPPVSSVSTSEPQASYSVSNIQDVALKQYVDHDGANKYASYIMTMHLKTSSYQSQKIALKYEIIGSQFLTTLQNLQPKAEAVEQPAQGADVILSINDGDDTTLYHFHENGMIFTVQKGSLYYLGSDRFISHMYTSIFTSAAVDKAMALKIQSVNLPRFNPNASMGNTTTKEQAISARPNYTAANYNVAVNLTNYGVIDFSVVIQNENDKAKILESISSMSEIKEQSALPGLGPVIRIYTGDVCHDYMVIDSLVKSYQVDNASLYFTAPDGFKTMIDYATAKAIAYALTE